MLLVALSLLVKLHDRLSVFSLIFQFNFPHNNNSWLTPCGLIGTQIIQKVLSSCHTVLPKQKKSVIGHS